jgi:hypothetical protein
MNIGSGTGERRQTLAKNRPEHGGPRQLGRKQHLLAGRVNWKSLAKAAIFLSGAALNGGL